MCLQGILKCISTKRLMNEIIGLLTAESTNKDLSGFLISEEYPAFILRSKEEVKSAPSMIYSRLKYAKIFMSPSLLYLFLYDQSAKYKGAISSLVCLILDKLPLEIWTLASSENEKEKGFLSLSSQIRRGLRNIFNTIFLSLMTDNDIPTMTSSLRVTYDIASVPRVTMTRFAALWLTKTGFPKSIRTFSQLLLPKHSETL